MMMIACQCNLLQLLLEDVVIAAFRLPLRGLDHGLGVENDLGSAVIKRRALTILDERRRQYAYGFSMIDKE